MHFHKGSHFSLHLISLLVLCLCIARNLSAQQSSPGSWTILNTKLTLDDRWSLFGEGQLRSTNFYDDFFYFEIKGGATYTLNDNISLTAGTGRYHTYTSSSPGNFVTPLTQGETRTWFQVTMDQLLDRINFEHRYRVEQRFTTNGYRNRFRYRLTALIPINHAEVIPRTWYASISDEIFFSNKAPYYERNRFFAGIGYKTSSTITIQGGYLRQFDYRIDNPSSGNFLQVSLLLSYRLKDSKDSGLPAITD